MAEYKSNTGQTRPPTLLLRQCHRVVERISNIIQEIYSDDDIANEAEFYAL